MKYEGFLDLLKYYCRMHSDNSVVVVGGCGHVGLPLSASLANAGYKVFAFDINSSSVNSVVNKEAPFWEPDLDDLLIKTSEISLFATTNPECIRAADTVIMIVGTPLDVHLNPDPNAVVFAVEQIASHLRDGQLLILRSTVFPGVTKRVEKLIHNLQLDIEVTFCPERIAEGVAVKELHQLPQIVGARTEISSNRSAKFFEALGVEIVKSTPEEAEFTKLFTNTWRYIKFAAANQFWMVASEAGEDFESIRKLMSYNYPRAADIPGPGFAAGPCLFKDTMQLATFSGNKFPLGQAAMLVNEGQPDFLVELLERDYDLENMKVGILGMAFKGESDDIRSSLAYKLKKILKFRAGAVLTTDPYVRDDDSLLPLDQVVKSSDLLIIAAPHKIYSSLEVTKPIIDIWNLRN